MNRRFYFRFVDGSPALSERTRSTLSVAEKNDEVSVDEFRRLDGRVLWCGKGLSSSTQFFESIFSFRLGCQCWWSSRLPGAMLFCM